MSLSFYVNNENMFLLSTICIYRSQNIFFQQLSRVITIRLIANYTKPSIEIYEMTLMLLGNCWEMINHITHSTAFITISRCYSIDLKVACRKFCS